MKNGRDIGRDHAETLQQFLDSGAQVPRGRDGAVNITKLADVTRIPKSSFYQNGTIRGVVEALDGVARQRPEEPGGSTNDETTAKSVKGETQSEKKVQGLERRVHGLEQQNAALVAENFELRRQVKELRLQIGRQDMMIDTGRRIVAPQAEE